MDCLALPEDPNQFELGEHQTWDRPPIARAKGEAPAHAVGAGRQTRDAYWSLAAYYAIGRTTSEERRTVTSP